MLPRLQQALDQEELEQLGMQLRMAKSRAPVSPSLEGEVSEDMSKDELYEKAQQMGIQGRSDMTKDELADAVQGGK